MNLRLPNFLGFILIAALTTYCGVWIGNHSDADPTSSAIPDDSTGDSGTMTLTVTSDDTFSLQGPGQQPGSSGITLPNGLTIQVGKVVVSRIKLLNTSDTSDRETAIESQKDAFEAGESEEKGNRRQEIDSALKTLMEEYDALIAVATTDEEKEELRELEDQARLELEKELAGIELEIEDAQDEYEETNDDALKFPEVYVYDLVNRQILPEAPTITLADGSYPRLSFETRPFRGEDDVKFINRSILVEGQLARAEATHRFEFEVRQPLLYVLRGTESFVIDPQEENSLIIKFKIEEWFREVPLDQAELTPRGEIHINSIANKTLFEKIQKNIRRSTTFGEDADGDGALGDDEAKGDGTDYVD